MSIEVRTDELASGDVFFVKRANDDSCLYVVISIARAKRDEATLLSVAGNVNGSRSYYQYSNSSYVMHDIVYRSESK